MHVGEYFKEVPDSLPANEKRERNRLKRELERLALKVDAGDIRNKRVRELVITIRRNAMKNQNSNAFVFHNFDSLQANRLQGRVAAQYDGVIGSISPWLELKLVNEKKRVGKKMLQLDYDVYEGDVSLDFEVKRHDYFSRYNALVFDICGPVPVLTVCLKMKDGSFVSSKVQDVGNTWRTLSIPFSTMDGYASFDPSNVAAISFVINRYGTVEQRGSFYLDSFQLKRVSKSREVAAKNNFRYEVEGAVPLGTNKSFLQHE